MTSEISKFKVLEATDMQTENVTLPVPMPGKEKELTFLFSDFFVVPQKVL